jgi:E3 ubiquitin-protein ligase TRIP12
LNKRAFLEVQYQEEQGTGLGPTMEFYCIVADEITNKKKEIWRKSMPDNGLFPAPLALTTGNGSSNEDIQKVYELFRLAGTMIAKSIVDDRLIDLPLSSLFWDLLLGKVIIL